MSSTLLAVAAFTAVVAAAQSVLGERMISRGSVGIAPRFHGIMRANWHTSALFGLAFAAIMLRHGFYGEHYLASRGQRSSWR